MDINGSKYMYTGKRRGGRGWCRWLLSLMILCAGLLFGTAAKAQETDISGAVVKAYDYQWPGATLYVSPEVWMNGRLLARDRDYTLSYEDNDRPGISKVIITGIGAYTGQKTVTFRILYRYYVWRYPNGAAGEPEVAVLAEGDAFTLGQCFARTGYYVASWNTEPDGSGSSYPSGGGVGDLAERPDQVVELYAQWEPVRYTVVFNAHGGTGGMAHRNMVYDRTSRLTLNAYERTGYTFTGWNTRPDGSGKAYADGEAVKNLTSKDGAAVTLYAQWSVNHYSIVFDANGGSGKAEDMKLRWGLAVRLTANAFTREDWTFTGWNTNKDGSGTACADRAAVKNLSKKDGAAVTLYAQWRRNTYTVRFDANGGKGTTAGKQFTIGKSARLRACGFKRTGFTFAGWNTKKDGSGTAYADRAAVKNLSKKDGAVITLYAQWRRNTCTVRFDANGGSGTTAAKEFTYGKSARLRACGFKRTGFTFTGWNTEPDGSGTAYADRAAVKNLSKKDGAVITLYAQWRPNTCTVRFDANGGSGTTAAKEFTYGKSARLRACGFKRTGFTFAGWNTKKDGSGTAYADRAAVKNLSKKDGAVITLYAQWRPVKSKLTLDGPGSVTEGFSARLTCTVTQGTAGTLTYTSSDTGVLTVDRNGLVRGVRPGTATVTVTSSNGGTASRTITVYENARYFSPSSSVSDYGSGVRIAAKKLRYSGGRLVLTAYVINNSAYTVDGYSYISANVTAGGSRIASQRFENLELDLAPYSVRTITLTFDGADHVNLRNGASASAGGSYWYH